MYYDCTNFYFEIEEADGLKQYGLSKEEQSHLEKKKTPMVKIL